MGSIFLRNRLNYPGGMPGVNPAFFASTKAGGTNLYQTLKLSGVAISGQASFLRLDVGSGAPTKFGSPVSASTGTMGPVYSNTGTGDGIYFITKSGTNVGIAAGYTLAVIAASTGTQGANAYLLTSNRSGLEGLGIKNAASTFSPGFWSGGGGFTDISGALGTIAQKVPVFYAISISSTGAGSAPYSALMMNLATGAITTTTGTTTATTDDSGDDDVAIGNFAGAPGSQGVIGYIAAVAVLRSYVSLRSLMLWAQNPWDFWYPPQVSQLVTASVANPSGNATSLRNRAITGVGL